jgi:hypothetical protein
VRRDAEGGEPAHARHGLIAGSLLAPANERLEIDLDLEDAPAAPLDRLMVLRAA